MWHYVTGWVVPSHWRCRHWSPSKLQELLTQWHHITFQKTWILRTLFWECETSKGDGSLFVKHQIHEWQTLQWPATSIQSRNTLLLQEVSLFLQHQEIISQDFLRKGTGEVFRTLDFCSKQNSWQPHEHINASSYQHELKQYAAKIQSV